jgi:excinuclease ABC subunit C
VDSSETSPDRSHLPHACGVYLMRDAGGEVIYIGKANDLAKRVANYFNPAKRDLKTSVLTPLIRKIDYIPCSSEREALLLEQRLVKRQKPFFNIDLKDDKSYPFVKVSLGEDFPRVFLTRKKVDDGGVYFGPFPKVTPVRKLLRYLWQRKFFPLRPCRWDFSVEKPLAQKKISGCIYYHTKECPAPCASGISRDDYRRYADDVILFFRGQYPALQKRFEEEMRQASSRLEYERAGQLRDNIKAIAQMGERVRVRAVREEDVSGDIAASESVTDLQRVLGLESPPFHVECFDISHFQGRQTVASMVCFMGGRPHKAHYRKFKIRDVEGVDDFKSMAEVVRRRYSKLKKDGGLPDLIVVDGGKGQLGAALSSLQDAKVKVPIVSLAKRLEEVFVPGREDSLLMETGRPALSLLQRLRDEAHRFGVTYHRLLRDKALGVR